MNFAPNIIDRSTAHAPDTLPKRRWIIMLAALVTACSAPAWARNYALIVAVRDHPDCRSLTSLPGVNRDAVRLRQVLEDGGFARQDVELVYNEAADSAHQPTRRNILDRLSSLLARATSQDLVLVVATGHGLVFNNASYLCPADATEHALQGGPAAGQRLVAVQSISDRLAECAARSKLLVVDACRDASRSRTRGFVRALQKPPQNVWLISSCSEQQYSYVSDRLVDGELHAVFTYYLGEGLAGAADLIGNNDGAVSLFELYSYTYAKTLDEVLALGERQNPEIFGGTAAPFTVATTKIVSRRRLRSGDPVLTRQQTATSLAHRGNDVIRGAELRFVQKYRRNAEQSARGYAVDDEPLYRNYHREVCYALGNYLTPALEFDPDCKTAHLARGWAYRASGMYQAALEAFRRVDEPLDLYVKGSPTVVDSYLTSGANGQAALARRADGQTGPPVPVIPLHQSPTHASPSLANVSAYSKVRIGDVNQDTWLLVTAVDDNPLPQPGWVHRDRLVWFAEAVDMSTSASPMFSGGGVDRAAMAFSRLDYAAQNLNNLADRLDAPIDRIESAYGAVQSIPFIGGYLPGIPGIGYIREPASQIRRVAGYINLPSSYAQAAVGWAGAAQDYRVGMQRAQEVQTRRQQLLEAHSIAPVAENPINVDLSLWRDTSLLAARASSDQVADTQAEDQRLVVRQASDE